jgi:hypothetical protein
MPNIENAVHSLSGQSEADLFIVCEDEWAACLIEANLRKKERDIVSISGYGCKTELITKAEAIHKATGKKVLIVWDGDVEENLLKKGNALNNYITATKLPGTCSPEKFMLGALTKETIKNKIMEDYDMAETDWTSLRNKLLSITDEHDLFFVLSKELSVNQTDVGKRICKIVAQAKKEDFATVKQMIENSLAGHTGGKLR